MKKDIPAVLLFVLLGAITPVLAETEPGPCRRVVSLAPSITETIFALGLGGSLVGVTYYCRYPEAAQEIPKIGGLYDINYEKMLMLQPSLVVILDDHRAEMAQLTKLKLPFLTVSHRTIPGILASFDQIGQVCGAQQPAAKLHKELADGIAEVKEKTSKLRPVRAVVVVGRSDVSKVARNVFISGRDGFYSNLLPIAGGVNVYDGATAGAANFSPEALALLAPEVIVEVIQDFETRGWSLEQIRASWKHLNFVPAVRDNKIYVISGDYTVIPGPRVLSLIKDMLKVLHPEVIS